MCENILRLCVVERALAHACSPPCTTDCSTLPHHLVPLAQGWYDLRIVQELIEALAAAAQPCSSCQLTCYCQAASPAAAGSGRNDNRGRQLDAQLRAALDAFKAAQARAQVEVEVSWQLAGGSGSMQGS